MWGSLGCSVVRTDPVAKPDLAGKMILRKGRNSVGESQEAKHPLALVVKKHA